MLQLIYGTTPAIWPVGCAGAKPNRLLTKPVTRSIAKPIGLGLLSVLPRTRLLPKGAAFTLFWMFVFQHVHVHGVDTAGQHVNIIEKGNYVPPFCPSELLSSLLSKPHHMHTAANKA